MLLFLSLSTGCIERLTWTGVKSEVSAIAGGIVEVRDLKSILNGAKVEVPPGLMGQDREVEIAKANDIFPSGYVAMGPAVRFKPESVNLPLKSVYNFKFTIPLNPKALPSRHASIAKVVVFRLKPNSTIPVAPPFSNMIPDIKKGTLTFEAGAFTTYQAAIRADAGQPTRRLYTFRAMTGISMGANGAASIGMRNHEKFDIIAPMGGYTDWIYMTHYMENYMFAGFCKAQDPTCQLGVDYLGKVNPTEQYQEGQDFNNWIPNDNGGNFDRSDYVQFMQDFALAYGNYAFYNPNSPYLAPGLALSYLDKGDYERCQPPIAALPITICNYEYNPHGAYPVIPVCDGEDGDPKGSYDPSKAHHKPFEVLLAIDVNGNGKRDYAEPVFFNSHERYQDIGADGLPDHRETGPKGAYHAVNNPDPAGDNYHYLLNPTGTEKNWKYDQGEPFEDYGLDGVQAHGPCQADYGEGNGRYDNNPWRERFMEHGIRAMLKYMSKEELARLNIYIDAGIRDFASSVVNGNQTIGGLAALGLSAKAWSRFCNLPGAPCPNGFFEFNLVEASLLGDHVLVRYGNPDATEREKENGDGKHVGTVEQVLGRFMTLYSFLDAKWPGGDYKQEELADLGRLSRIELFFSPAVAVCREKSSRICLPQYSNMECATDSQCPNGEYCDFGHCHSRPGIRGQGCDNGSQCTDHKSCLFGNCYDGIKSCTVNADCQSGEVCGPRLCDRDDSCMAGEKCQYSRCIKLKGRLSRCVTDADCPSNETCEGERTYSILLPPGYFNPANSSKRYPVVYINHGYGQEPHHLNASVIISGTYMMTGDIQKMIIVFPDGKCNLEECKRGSWYANGPGVDGTSRYRFEDSVIELLEHIDRKYRTKRQKWITLYK